MCQLFFTTAFDPKPFIRTFESAVGELINLRQDLQKKTEAAGQSAKKAEKEYTNKLTELNSGFDVCRLTVRIFNMLRWPVPLGSWEVFQQHGNQDRTSW